MAFTCEDSSQVQTRYFIRRIREEIARDTFYVSGYDNHVAVFEVLQKNQVKLARCITSHVSEREVSLDIEVAPTGVVRKVSLPKNSFGEEIGRCFRRQVSQWRFAPHKHKRARVVLPLTQMYCEECPGTDFSSDSWRSYGAPTPTLFVPLIPAAPSPERGS